MPRLVVNNVGKRFGRRLLFRKLSFELEGGRVLAVTGANGSGKSTLLRILAGVLRPSKGEVTLHVNGEVIAGEERPLHTGFVAPYLNVYDGFSARENLVFLAKARRLSHASHRIDEVLDQVALSARADDLVGTYSSGMKQRVKYAAALLAAPPLLLLDEPSSNLDTAGVAMVERVIEHQRDAGCLVIVATNVPDEAARCDDEVYIGDFL
ncbi:MAG: ATP-binding cassette domain-containing protein [Rhodothermales bacterium]